MTTQRIVGAAIGNCVHVAGILNFLSAARRSGCETEFLGPATSIDQIVAVAASGRADVLALSYRLTPSAAERLLTQLKEALARADVPGQRMVFGGTEPSAQVALRSGLFEAVFGGPGGPTVEEYLSGASSGAGVRDWGHDLIDRIERRHPRPVIRHHFGLPDLEETIGGISRIAESGVVDVISIAPDQNAQEHFFHPERMDPVEDGAGGVPVRSPDDFGRLREASQRGNHPLLRCYAGTNDQLAFAAILQETIDNAWAAVPVFWYSELDGRSQRPLEVAIEEQNEVVAWCAAERIPVERNDQNQWGLRHAHDALQVAAAALAVHLSARTGVETYVLQMMLNTPPGITPSMDVAKMDAMHTMARRFSGDDLHIVKETRAGLFSLPPDPDRARGQLASSLRTALLLDPEIIHVVGHTEAHHAAEADEVVASCLLADQVITDALADAPDPLLDARVAARRDHLLAEADYLLSQVEQRLPSAFDGDPEALGRIVRSGLFDAPHLAGSGVARGRVVTVVDGGCDAVDPTTGELVDEKARLTLLGRS